MNILASVLLGSHSYFIHISIYHLWTKTHKSHFKGDKKWFILEPNISNHGLGIQISVTLNSTLQMVAVSGRVVVGRGRELGMES